MKGNIYIMEEICVLRENVLQMYVIVWGCVAVG